MFDSDGTVGMRLDTIADQYGIYHVENITPGGPIEQSANVRIGDGLICIGNFDCRGAPFDEIRSRVKGPIGSSVELFFVRAGIDQIIRVNVTRAMKRQEMGPNFPSVSYNFIDWAPYTHGAAAAPFPPINPRQGRELIPRSSFAVLLHPPPCTAHHRVRRIPHAPTRLQAGARRRRRRWPRDPAPAPRGRWRLRRCPTVPRLSAPSRGCGPSQRATRQWSDGQPAPSPALLCAGAARGFGGGDAGGRGGGGSAGRGGVGGTGG